MAGNPSSVQAAPPLRFGLYLALLIALSSMIYLAFAWYAKSHWDDLAPQFSPNTVFNQKILYIRNIWSNKKPADLIVGSSMALNNFDSDRLSQLKGTRAINLGATGLSLSGSNILMNEVIGGIPINDIIIVTQFNELRNDEPGTFSVPPPVFSRYVAGQMSFVEEFSYRDLSSMFDLVRQRATVLKDRTDYSSAAFTPSGAAPLEIYGPARDPGRWNGDGIHQQATCEGCRRTLEQLCRAAARASRQVTIVVPPISPHLSATRPEFKARYDQQRRAIGQTAAACGARALDVGAMARFDDSCFADSLHLNAEGARALTDLFIRRSRPSAPDGPSEISCRTVAGVPQHAAAALARTGPRRPGQPMADPTGDGSPHD